MIVAILLSLSGSSAVSHVAPYEVAAPIAWSAKRALKWSDFRGAPPSANDSEQRPSGTPDRERHSGSRSSHAALTTCTLRISVTDSASSEQQRGGQWRCTVRLSSVKAEALFEPSKSWVRPGAESTALLAHEQIHFDLGHIQSCRALARITRELASQTFTAQGTDSRMAESAARGKFTRAADRIIAEERAALNARNELYDAETAHGTKPDEQKRWAEMIERELRELGEYRRATR